MKATPEVFRSPAPDEDTLMIATRMRDLAFKRVLQTMTMGAT
jgi:hypothetical protein